MTRIVRRSAAAFVLCAAALAAGSAAAGDYPEANPYPLAYDWTGFYLGAHAGIAWSQTSHQTPGLEFDLDDLGALGGGLLGFNLQYGYLVYGIEADFTAGEINNDAGVDGGPFAVPVPATFDIQPVSTIRGRVGFAVDNWYLYATGGIAFADADLSFATGNPGNSDSNVHIGYVVGCGLEYAITDYMTVRADYLFSKYKAEDYHIVVAPAGPVVATFDTDFKVHTLRAGITFNVSRWF
jgi:outer membrane immunogenic protein